MGESDGIVWDKSKGELRILGQRHLAMDAQALCDHLDSLVGPTVAEVIVNNHEFRLGKEDAARFRRERPTATDREIVDTIIETDLLSGTGITKITLPETQNGDVLLQIMNPCVRATLGAGKTLLTSYWCGLISFILGGEFEVTDVYFKEAENMLIARMVRR